MGDHIQVPVDDLETIGSGLNTVKGDLEAVEGGATLVDGLDPQHGGRIVDPSVHNFHDEWKTSRKKLMDAIGALGSTSKTISSSTAQVDEGIGKAYRQNADAIATVDYRGSIDAGFSQPTEGRD